MMLMSKLIFLHLILIHSKYIHGFGIINKYKEIIGSIGISFGKDDLQCIKHMNTLSKKTTKDNLQTVIDMFSTDKSKLKDNFDNLFYNNGSCFYLSRRNIMKSYDDANTFCRDIGTNNFSSLYEMKNRNEYEYLLNKTAKIFNKIPDNYKYLSYYLGLKSDENNDIGWKSGRLLSMHEKSIIFFNKSENLANMGSHSCFALSFVGSADNRVVEPFYCGRANGFVCKFVLDYCEGHNTCGTNGYCKSNIKMGKFECECHIFYQGEFCDQWSYQGIQIVVCFVLIFLAIASILVSKYLKQLITYWSQPEEENPEDIKPRYSIAPLKMKVKSKYNVEQFNYGLFDSFFRFIRKKPKIFVLIIASLVMTFTLIILVPLLKDQVEKLLEKRHESRLKYFIYTYYWDLCSLKRNFLIENYVFIIFSMPLTLFLYFWNSFHLDRKKRLPKKKRIPATKNAYTRALSDEGTLKKNEAVIDTDDSGDEARERPSKEITSTKKSSTINSDRLSCKFNFRILVPMNPFAKNNRLITCIIYAAYIHNISKIFEFSMSDFGLDDLHKLNTNRTNDSTGFTNVISSLYTFQSFNVYGILVDLLLKILNVFIIGFHFYPVLLCVEFKRRSKLSYLLCSIYVWMLFFYYVFVNELCKRDEMDMKQIVQSLINSGKNYVQGFAGQNDLNLTSIAVSISSFKNKTKLYKITDKFKNYTEKYNVTLKKNLVARSKETLKLEEIVFYVILCLIAVNLTVEYILIVLNQILKFAKFNILGLFNSNKINIVNKGIEYESDSDYEIARVKNELNYTANIFRQNANTKVSYLKSKFESYIYRKHPYFRFSKQFLNIHIIAFILIYYVTFFIIRRSEIISYVFTYSFAIVLNLVFKKFLTDENITKITGEINYQVSDIMIKTCILTTVIYVVQLIFGIKKYQSNVLKAYKGIYNDIPSPKKYSNASLTSGSLHYSGYAIGFLIIGYGILSCVNFFLVIILKLLVNFPLLKLDILKYVLPILTIFLFKRILIWYLCRFVLTHRTGKTMRLKNMRLYLIVNHFNFFFDSFIIFFIALMRVFTSVLATLFFMPRLDYSVFGLFLERFDMGFMSYISFLHMEVNQSHPIKLAFCELVKRYSNDPNYRNLTKEKKLVRNRWNLAYTLFRNPYLKRERKSYVKEQSIYHRDKKETLRQFMKRKTLNVVSAFKINRKNKEAMCMELKCDKSIRLGKSPNPLIDHKINSNEEKQVKFVDPLYHEIDEQPERSDDQTIDQKF